MQCRICALNNSKLIDDIERLLVVGQGTLMDQDRVELAKKYPEYESKIWDIGAQDCQLHFNFHQQISRVPSGLFTPSDDEKEVLKKPGSSTIAGDIGKDEAEILYEVLNKQAATFNALTSRINDAIVNCERDASALMIHPETINFYNALSQSMRLTVRELRDLDTAKNGSKDGAVEGLKALAAALAPKAVPTVSETESDMTTKEFDD